MGRWIEIPVTSEADPRVDDHLLMQRVSERRSWADTVRDPSAKRRVIAPPSSLDSKSQGRTGFDALGTLREDPTLRPLCPFGRPVTAGRFTAAILPLAGRTLAPGMLVGTCCPHLKYDVRIERVHPVDAELMG